MFLIKLICIISFLQSLSLFSNDNNQQVPVLEMYAGCDHSAKESLTTKALRYIVNNISKFNTDQQELLKSLAKNSSAIKYYRIYAIGPLYQQLVYKKKFNIQDLISVYYNADKPWCFGFVEIDVFYKLVTRKQVILFNAQTEKKIILKEGNDLNEPKYMLWNHYYYGFSTNIDSDSVQFSLYNIYNSTFQELKFPKLLSYNINQKTPYIYMTDVNLFIIYSLLEHKIKTSFSFLKNQTITFAKDIAPSEYIIQAGSSHNYSIWLFNSLHNTLTKIHPSGYFYADCSKGGYIGWTKADNSEFLITKQGTPLLKILIKSKVPLQDTNSQQSNNHPTRTQQEIKPEKINGNFLNDHLLLLIALFNVENKPKEVLKVLNCHSQTLHDAEGISSYTNTFPKDYLFSKESPLIKSILMNVDNRQQHYYLQYFHTLHPALTPNESFKYTTPFEEGYQLVYAPQL